jgi:hypothetical protein
MAGDAAGKVMSAFLAIGLLSRARPVNRWPPRSASHRRTAGSLARQSLQAGMPGPTTPTRTRPSRRLPPRRRNLLLTTHVVVAVGVLGTDLVLLTLGTTALVSGDPELVRASYLAMGLLADAVLEPLALAAPLPGILVGLGTPGALTRHTWVLAKLVLTIGVGHRGGLGAAARAAPRRRASTGGVAGRAVDHRHRPARGRGDPGTRGGTTAVGHRDPGGLQALGPHTIRPHGRDQQMTTNTRSAGAGRALRGSPASEGYAVRRGSR